MTLDPKFVQTRVSTSFEIFDLVQAQIDFPDLFQRSNPKRGPHELEFLSPHELEAYIQLVQEYEGLLRFPLPHNAEAKRQFALIKSDPNKSITDATFKNFLKSFLGECWREHVVRELALEHTWRQFPTYAQHAAELEKARYSYSLHQDFAALSSPSLVKVQALLEKIKLYVEKAKKELILLGDRSQIIEGKEIFQMRLRLVQSEPTCIPNPLYVNPKFFQKCQTYIQHIEEKLEKQNKMLTEAMHARLKLASESKDITCDDLLYNVVQKIKIIVGRYPKSLFIKIPPFPPFLPEAPHRTLDANSLSVFLTTLLQRGTSELGLRVHEEIAQFSWLSAPNGLPFKVMLKQSELTMLSSTLGGVVLTFPRYMTPFALGQFNLHMAYLYTSFTAPLAIPTEQQAETLEAAWNFLHQAYERGNQETWHQSVHKKWFQALHTQFQAFFTWGEQFIGNDKLTTPNFLSKESARIVCTFNEFVLYIEANFEAGASVHQTAQDFLNRFKNLRIHFSQRFYELLKDPNSRKENILLCIEFLRALHPKEVAKDRRLIIVEQVLIEDDPSVKLAPIKQELNLSLEFSAAFCCKDVIREMLNKARVLKGTLSPGLLALYQECDATEQTNLLSNLRSHYENALSDAIRDAHRQMHLPEPRPYGSIFRHLNYIGFNASLGRSDLTGIIKGIITHCLETFEGTHFRSLNIMLAFGEEADVLKYGHERLQHICNEDPEELAIEEINNHNFTKIAKRYPTFLSKGSLAHTTLLAFFKRYIDQIGREVTRVLAGPDKAIFNFKVNGLVLSEMADVARSLCPDEEELFAKLDEPFFLEIQSARFERVLTLLRFNFYQFPLSAEYSLKLKNLLQKLIGGTWNWHTYQLCEFFSKCYPNENFAVHYRSNWLEELLENKKGFVDQYGRVYSPPLMTGLTGMIEFYHSEDLSTVFNCIDRFMRRPSYHPTTHNLLRVYFDPDAIQPSLEQRSEPELRYWDFYGTYFNSFGLYDRFHRNSEAVFNELNADNFTKFNEQIQNMCSRIIAQDPSLSTLNAYVDFLAKTVEIFRNKVQLDERLYPHASGAVREIIVAWQRLKTIDRRITEWGDALDHSAPAMARYKVIWQHIHSLTLNQEHYRDLFQNYIHKAHNHLFMSEEDWVLQFHPLKASFCVEVLSLKEKLILSKILECLNTSRYSHISNRALTAFINLLTNRSANPQQDLALIWEMYLLAICAKTPNTFDVLNKYRADTDAFKETLCQILVREHIQANWVARVIPPLLDYLFFNILPQVFAGSANDPTSSRGVLLTPSKFLDNLEKVINVQEAKGTPVWEQTIFKLFFDGQMEQDSNLVISHTFGRLSFGDSEVGVYNQLFDSTGTPKERRGTNSHINIPLRIEKEIMAYVKFYHNAPGSPGIQIAATIQRNLIVKKEDALHYELLRFPASTAAQVNPYPVLLSQFIPGTPLHEMWKEHPTLTLNLEYFSFEYVRVLLDRETDGKPQNYKCQRLPSNEYRLVPVEIEEALGAPVFKGEVLHKSVIYCFNEMRKSVHPAVVKWVLELDTFAFINSLIDGVTSYNNRLNQEEGKAVAFTAKECEKWKNKIDAVHLQAPLTKYWLDETYRILTDLKRCFTENPFIDHLTLLQNIYPELTPIIVPHFREIHTAPERFNLAFGASYLTVGDTNMTLIQGERFYLSLTPYSVGKKESDETSPYTTRQAHDAFDSLRLVTAPWIKIRGSLMAKDLKAFLQCNDDQKEKVLNGMPGRLEPFKLSRLLPIVLEDILKILTDPSVKLVKLNFSDCTACREAFTNTPILSTEVVINILKSKPFLEHLDLSGCTHLKDQDVILILDALQSHCPKLKELNLSRMNLTALAWKPEAEAGSFLEHPFILEAFSEIDFKKPCQPPAKIECSAPNKLRVLWSGKLFSFRNLENLFIDECPRIESIFIIAPKLRRLRARHCPFLTNVRVMTFGPATANFNESKKLSKKHFLQAHLEMSCYSVGLVDVKSNPSEDNVLIFDKIKNTLSVKMSAQLSIYDLFAIDYILSFFQAKKVQLIGVPHVYREKENLRRLCEILRKHHLKNVIIDPFKVDNTAYQWYALMADEGYVEGQYNFAQSLLNGLPLTPSNVNQFTSEQIKALPKLSSKEQTAINWFATGAVQGHAAAIEEIKLAAMYRGSAEAQHILGYCYDKQIIEGLSSEKSQSLAIEWYKKAAQQDHPGSQFNLGLYYLSPGKGQQPDIANATLYFERAKTYYVESIKKLGDCAYARGDIQKAVDYYVNATRAGSIDAHYSLGKHYWDKGDRERAYNYFREAGKAGHAISQYYLGCWYIKLYGEEKVEARRKELIQLANEWWGKAAEKGILQAKTMLQVVDRCVEFSVKTQQAAPLEITKPSSSHDVPFGSFSSFAESPFTPPASPMTGLTALPSAISLLTISTEEDQPSRIPVEGKFDFCGTTFQIARTERDSFSAIHALLGTVQNGRYLCSNPRTHIATLIHGRLLKLLSLKDREVLNSPLWKKAIAFIDTLKNYIALPYGSMPCDKKLLEVWRNPLSNLDRQLKEPQGELERFQATLFIERWKIVEPLVSNFILKLHSPFKKDFEEHVLIGKSLDELVKKEFKSILKWFFKKLDLEQISSAYTKLMVLESRLDNLEENVFNIYKTFISSFYLIHLDKLFINPSYFVCRSELDILAEATDMRILIVNDKELLTTKINKIDEDVLVIRQDGRYFYRCEVAQESDQEEDLAFSLAEAHLPSRINDNSAQVTGEKDLTLPYFRIEEAPMIPEFPPGGRLPPVPPQGIQVGLRNFERKTCWANSILKFISCTTMYDDMLTSAVQEVTLQALLREIIVRLRTGVQVPDSYLQAFLNEVYRLVPTLIKGQQNDAPEFLITLTRILQWHPLIAQGESLVQMNREGRFPRVVKNYRDPYHAPMVENATSHVDIYAQEILEQLNLPQIHRDEDYIDVAGERRLAWNCFINLPSCFMVYIHRGINRNGMLLKSNLPIQMTPAHQILFSNYQLEMGGVEGRLAPTGCKFMGQFNYRIAAAIEHIGDTLDKGHYVCYERAVDGSLIRHSDLDVSRNLTEEEFGVRGYFLRLERTGPTVT